MATKQSVRIVKSFTYRGNTRLWSNRYFLVQAISSGNRGAVMDAIVNAEKLIYEGNIEIVRGEFMQAGSDVVDLANTYSQFGTATFADAGPTPGDAAAVVRYSTSQRSSKNHPIYLFNYYHGVFYDAATTSDALNPAQKTAIETYAQDWINGITYGGGAGVVSRCGPNGAVALQRLVESYVGHRDLT